MKKDYHPPEILKILVDLQDILTNSNELEPDITPLSSNNELEPDIIT